jgi:hypothetical protein
MTIMEMLKDGCLDVRITHGTKWMIYEDGIWVVYEKQYRSRRTTEIECETEHVAVACLLAEKGRKK